MTSSHTTQSPANRNTRKYVTTLITLCFHHTGKPAVVNATRVSSPQLLAAPPSVLLSSPQAPLLVPQLVKTRMFGASSAAPSIAPRCACAWMTTCENSAIGSRARFARLTSVANAREALT
eukprot:6426693-Amphidinium_carterae.1